MDLGGGELIAETPTTEKGVEVIKEPEIPEWSLIKNLKGEVIDVIQVIQEIPETEIDPKWNGKIKMKINDPKTLAYMSKLKIPPEKLTAGKIYYARKSDKYKEEAEIDALQDDELKLLMFQVEPRFTQENEERAKRRNTANPIKKDDPMYYEYLRNYTNDGWGHLLSRNIFAYEAASSHYYGLPTFVYVTKIFKKKSGRIYVRCQILTENGRIKNQESVNKFGMAVTGSEVNAKFNCNFVDFFEIDADAG